MDKKPRQRAVAVKYSPEESAPKVVAKGGGIVAEKILEHAGDVPVYQDAQLVDELTRVDIGEHIPPELYDVVAQVLVFISELDREAGRAAEPGYLPNRLQAVTTPRQNLASQDFDTPLGKGVTPPQKRYELGGGVITG